MFGQSHLCFFILGVAEGQGELWTSLDPCAFSCTMGILPQFTF